MRLYAGRTLVPTLREVLHDVRREGVPVAHLLEGVCVRGDVAALGCNSVPGHRWTILLSARFLVLARTFVPAALALLVIYLAFLSLLV